MCGRLKDALLHAYLPNSARSPAILQSNVLCLLPTSTPTLMIDLLCLALPTTSNGHTMRRQTWTLPWDPSSMPTSFTVESLPPSTAEPGYVLHKTTFRYLEADLLLTKRAAWPSAKLRIKDFRDRCAFIRRLPLRQRDICLADANTALWTDGGVAYTKGQLPTAISVGFYALANGSIGQNMRRSRATAPLLGPSAHRTHLPSVVILSWIRGILRSHLSGRADSGELQQQWLSHGSAVIGPAAWPIPHLTP